MAVDPRMKQMITWLASLESAELSRSEAGKGARGEAFRAGRLEAVSMSLNQAQGDPAGFAKWLESLEFHELPAEPTADSEAFGAHHALTEVRDKIRSVFGTTGDSPDPASPAES